MLSSRQPSLLQNSSSANQSVFNASKPNANSSGMSGPGVQPSSIDEKSVKDIIQILNKCIDKAKNLTEFSQVAQVDNIDAPSISGHTDFYYPNLVYQLAQYQQELPEITKIKRIPIPHELIEQFNQMQVTCYMGLFTCITRAWLTIDNLIFFWNYEDGSDISFYDSLTEAILAVELFKPKPATFDEGIEYGLCLATNSTVVLLSIDFIRFTKGNGAIVNEMKFSQQPIYSIPTENAIINTIKTAHNTGRLFMGARDGNLYEFTYHNQANWFGSQTKRINLSQSKLHYFVPSIFNFNEADSIIQVELDESRNVLYTRSENSTIQVFYLGANGQETSKISYQTCSTIAAKAATLINSNDKNLFSQIVHIAAIKRTESKNFNLVATTNFGIRLYFSINQFEQLASSNSIQNTENSGLNQHHYQTKGPQEPQAPTTFQLVHVRIPPNIDLSSQNRQGPISSAFVNDGLSLMVSKRDENSDSVLLLNKDEFLLHSNFKESKFIFDIEGRIWAIDEVLPSLSSIKSCAFENDLLQTAKSASGVENIPKLTAEFFDCPRRFVMMTPQGCFIWNKLRPIDQLYLVLKESNGPNSAGVRLFFNKIYERSEACALCLAVALLHSNETRICEWATHAYFIYSGEPEIKKKSPGGNFAMPQQPVSQAHQFAMPQQQFNQQPHQQQHYNPHSSLISESGLGDQLDQTAMNPYFRQQQQQNNQRGAFGLSYINSPQQMSTPIVMRTKDQLNGSIYGQPQQQQAFQSQQQQQPHSSNPQFSSQPQQGQDMHFKQLQSECELHFSGKHDAIYIYMSRLLAPIWDLKLLCELTPGLRANDTASLNTSLQEPLSFATFTEIDLQWFLNKLNELKRFLDLNFAHLKTQKYSHLNSALFGGFGSTSGITTDLNTSASQPSGFSKLNQQPGQLNQMQARFATQFSTMPINLSALINLTTSNNNNQGSTPITEEKLAIEIENGSIYLIKQFLNRIIEVIGLWKILDDHKYHFISTKLDDQTQLILMRMQIKSFLYADNNLLEKLITALLYRYIDDNACTDLLNQSLKQMCPSLYSNENAIYSKACEKLKQAINIKNDNYERERLLKEAVDLMKQIGYVANLSQVCETLQSAGCYEAIFELCLTAVEKRDPQNIGLYYYRKSEPSEDTQGQYYFNLRAECYKCMLDVLNSLLKSPGASAIAHNNAPSAFSSQQNQRPKESAEDQINMLIKYIVNSKDELAHVSLFNWMLNCGYEKKLVTLDSPFLENFLIREIKDQAKNRVYLDLLWRHYDFRKDYQNAAKVLTALAEKYSESQISLKERVEYLTQAIVALNSTQKMAIKDEVSELNDKKDVALLQEKIYIELSQIEQRTDAIQDALIQLDSQLFDITKLYYDFAEKFDLCQCQLAIFKMARHDDPKIVEIFWKQIIANELDKITDIKHDIKQSVLKNQLADNIVNIAKEYVDEEKYFPLITLIDNLEYISLSRGYEPEWGSTLLRKLNIPFNQLIQEYDRVYSRKDIKWAENSSRFIETIYCLIDIFTKAPNATNENDKVYFLRTVKDLMPKYMTELNTINDDLSKELISKFKTLNYMLERM